MASNGYPPGLLLPHEQRGVISLSKDCELMFPIPGFKQGMLRLPTPCRRTHPMDKQWNPISGFPESSQFVKIDPTFTTTALADARALAAELHERHEKAAKLGSMNLSLMSELVEFQMTITGLQYNQTTTCAHTREANFMDESPIHQGLLVNCDGRISFVGSVKEMMDLVSFLEEFYLPKGSARGSTQRILVPQFDWGGALETAVFDNEASLALESFKVCPKEAKPETTQRRRAKKRAPRERSIFRNGFYSACECFLRLMMDKNRDETAAIKSFKRTGPELPKLLMELSSTIAGAGVTVVLSVMCNLADGRVHFGASHFLTTVVGLGFFWLSWTVYKLRDAVVYIKRSPGNLGSEDVEGMVRKLDKSMNNIYRAAAFAAVAVLSLP